MNNLPTYLDAAATTPVDKRVLDVMQPYFSEIFGNELPGPNSLISFQKFKFIRPVYVNDDLLITVTVKDINKKKRKLLFNCDAYVKNKTVISGETEIFFPKKK